MKAKVYGTTNLKSLLIPIANAFPMLSPIFLPLTNSVCSIGVKYAAIIMNSIAVFCAVGDCFVASPEIIRNGSQINHHNEFSPKNLKKNFLLGFLSASVVHI